MTGLGASVLGAFTNPVTGILKLMILSAILLEIGEGVPFYKLLIYTACFIIAFIWVYIGSFVRLGYLDYNLALLDRRRAEDGGLFGASAIWWTSMHLHLTMIVRILPGMILLLIPGIITYYNYAMAPFLLEENRTMTAEEALRMSKVKMKGHRWEFFCLRMSFLGWKLLGLVTLGIAFFWINPYRYLSETVFFNECSGRAKVMYGR
ncbi:MAG: DUF975 family protein [Eubacterium sp.]|nr:DUF975 family protein [Eubacterium sp.]